MGKLIDLTGRVFGRLTVIGKADSYSSPSGKHRDTMWRCQCSCKDRNEIVVTRHRLVSGLAKSCGCIRREMTIERNLKGKANNFDLSGDFGIGYTAKGEVFWFDLEDYEKISAYCWHYDSEGYLVSNRRFPDGRRETIALHRLVSPEPPEGCVVDHRTHPTDPHGMKYDNRKENLRFVTRSQNAQNQIPLRENNTSGHKGVSWNKRGMWKASISANGKRYTRYFKVDEFDDACSWYEDMARKLHGEYQFKEA